MMTARLISVHVAARMLGVSADELKRLAKADAVPHVLLPGDRIRFCPSDMAEFIAARKRPAIQQPVTV